MAEKIFNWEFNIVDQRRAWKAFTLIMVLFFVMVFGGRALNININLLVTVTVITFLGGLLLTVRWIWRKESVTLFHDRIISTLYGEILLSDIKKVSSPWYAPVPNIKLHLPKRSVSWQMATSSRGFINNTPEEVADFNRFSGELQKLLAKQEQYNPAKKDTPLPGNTTSTPAAQLQKINSRSGPRNLTIAIGAALALLMLVRACSKSWFHRNDISRLKSSSEEMYQRRLTEVKQLVAERLKKEGSAFLYTNDHAATLQLMPYIGNDNPLNIDLFEHLEATRDMEAILRNKDSANLDIYVISGDSSIRRMTPGITGPPDSTETQFFLYAYDPSQHIRPANIPRGDTTGESSYPVFRACWGVNLKDTSHAVYAIGSSMPGMNIMLSQIRLRKTFYFYLTGKTKSGFNEAAFKSTITALNKLLHENKVDTALFITSRFN